MTWPRRDDYADDTRRRRPSSALGPVADTRGPPPGPRAPRPRRVGVGISTLALAIPHVAAAEDPRQTHRRQAVDATGARDRGGSTPAPLTSRRRRPRRGR